jgi:hypothetical protein
MKILPPLPHPEIQCVSRSSDLRRTVYDLTHTQKGREKTKRRDKKSKMKFVL